MPVRVSAFAFIVALAVAWPGGAPAAAAAEPLPSGGQLTVRAEGFAPADGGQSRSEVHRSALADARRNALMQAYVGAEVRAAVSRMRLADSTSRVRSAGYVQKMDVLNAGVVPGADPPVYRVKVRAIVMPLGQAGPQQALALNRLDPWRPAVALQVTGDVGEERRAQTRSRLVAALSDAGVETVGTGEPRPALALSVDVQVVDEGQPSFRMEWRMESAPPDQQGRAVGPGSFSGHWRLVGRSEPRARWWRKAGEAMARDALRLWAAPRWTVLRFEGANAEQMQALRRFFSNAVGSQVRRSEDDVLAVGLPLTGDPLDFARAALQRLDMAESARLAEASLSRLVFSFAAGPAGAAPPEALP